MYLILLGLLLTAVAAPAIVLHIARFSRHAKPVVPLSVAQIELRERLEKHIHHLAFAIGERHIWQPASLRKAADYLRQQLAVSGKEVHTEEWDEQEGRSVLNLFVEWPGRREPALFLVVGAHYDTVPGTPGANDNATGIAALLEIAAAMKTVEPDIGLRLVAFVNEEPPFFQTERMGSVHHAQMARARGEQLVGMFTLETLGFYTSESGSQSFPSPLLRLLYPSRGNFLAMVGDFRSAGLLRDGLAAFRQNSDFPTEGLAAPASLPGVGWSDHWSFWQQDYPAVMLTDTALFRYPHYHTDADTPDRLAMDEYTRVADGVVRMIRTMIFTDSAGNIE